MTPTTLYRTDPDRNMARYYRLDIERDLFGMWCVIREWGRIGRGGQLKCVSFETEEAAAAALALTRAAKQRRGYSIKCPI